MRPVSIIKYTYFNATFCGSFYFLVGSIRPSEFDVVFNRIVEKIYILKDHADILQNTIRSIVFHILSANSYSTILHIPKPGNQPGHGGLAAGQMALPER